jgi:hypothetical protein
MKLWNIENMNCTVLSASVETWRKKAKLGLFGDLGCSNLKLRRNEEEHNGRIVDHKILN